MIAQDIIDQIQANDLVLTRCGRNIDAMPSGPRACQGIPRDLIEALRAQVEDILPLLPHEDEAPKPCTSVVIPGNYPQQADLFTYQEEMDNG